MGSVMSSRPSMSFRCSNTWSLRRRSGNRYRLRLLIGKRNVHLNNKKDLAQLYSEAVQSYHYYRDPSIPTVRNQENKNPQRNHVGTTEGTRDNIC